MSLGNGFTLSDAEVLIINSAVWFIDDLLSSGYPMLDDFADYIYAMVDGAGLSVTAEELSYCAKLLNQRYPDFASAPDIASALISRFGDKIVQPKKSSAGMIFGILGISLLIGYLLHER